ncbi:MAG: hypothetical protein M1820_004555 [Bogoriella megaspora]|nr:MAG: hypothetical protein M1820_004555 [Bogoriella megaspora]
MLARHRNHTPVPISGIDYASPRDLRARAHTVPPWIRERCYPGHRIPQPMSGGALPPGGFTALYGHGYLNSGPYCGQGPSMSMGRMGMMPMGMGMGRGYGRRGMCPPMGMCMGMGRRRGEREMMMWDDEEDSDDDMWATRRTPRRGSYNRFDEYGYRRRPRYGMRGLSGYGRDRYRDPYDSEGSLYDQDVEDFFGGSLSGLEDEYDYDDYDYYPTAGRYRRRRSRY